MKKIFIIDYENTSMYGLLGMDRLDENSIVRIHCSKENLCELFDSIFGKKQEKLVDIAIKYFSKYIKSLL